MKEIIEDVESRIKNFSQHLFSIIQPFPYFSAIVIFLIVVVLFVLSVKSSSLAKAIAAIGTISAIIWALYHQEIKQYLDRPKLQINKI